MNNQLGELIKKLRKAKKLSLRAASAKTGLSFSHIRNLEENASIQPNPDTLKKLSIAYDHPYEDLMRVAGYVEHATFLQKIIDDPNSSEIKKELARRMEFADDEKVKAILLLLDAGLPSSKE